MTKNILLIPALYTLSLFLFVFTAVIIITNTYQSLIKYIVCINVILVLGIMLYFKIKQLNNKKKYQSKSVVAQIADKISIIEEDDDEEDEIKEIDG